MKEVTTMRQLERVGTPLGPRIRVARENAGMSQEELARRLGVELGSLLAWEEDRRTPRANRLLMMSGLLGVSLNWLLEGREDQYMAGARVDAIDALRQELNALAALLAEAQTTLASMRRRVDGLEAEAGTD